MRHSSKEILDDPNWIIEWSFCYILEFVFIIGNYSTQIFSPNDIILYNSDIQISLKFVVGIFSGCKIMMTACMKMTVIFQANPADVHFQLKEILASKAL